MTKDVDALYAAYAAANSVQFGKPDAGLLRGNQQDLQSAMDLS